MRSGPPIQTFPFPRTVSRGFAKEIPRLREGAQAIVDGKAEGKPTEFFGRQITVYNLGFTTFLCSGREKTDP